LGAGGSGLVFAAIQETLGREVAVKILNPFAASRPDAVDRFKIEANAIARLRHPGIVQIFEAGEFNGRPFLVMELINGGTLADSLAKGPLPVDQAADCLRQVAEAVGAAHAVGIVHRDLKPSNVLLEQIELNPTVTGSVRDSGSKLVPKVADFGLAKDLSDTSRTTTGVLIGTPSYMAPEQASGDPAAVGRPTDVYALGATLYACLTGHPPFHGTTMLETLDLVRTADPVSPRVLRPAVPRDLATICLKCLRKAPADRYPSAKDLAAALDRYLSGKPILARPVGPVYRTIKWCRRQPSVAALLALAVLVPLATAIVVGVYNAKLSTALGDLGEALAARTRERERANANYREARQAISRMLGRTGERSAVPIPQLLELERRQAEDAVVFFRAVIKDDVEPDDEVRFQVAEAIEQLAMRTGELNDITKGIGLHREALAVFDELSAAHPTDPRFRASRAYVHGQVGFALLGADPPQAERELQAAVDLYAALHQEIPAEADYAHRLGQFLQSLGTLRRRANQPQEAEAFFRKAVAAHESGMAVQPPTPVRRVMLPDSCIGAGLIAWQAKRYADANKAYAQADEQLTRALAEHPGNADAVLSLGILHINWGLLAREEGEPQVALSKFDRAIEVLSGLHQREPNMSRLRLPLSNVYGARSELLASLERYPAAATDLERRAMFISPDQVPRILKAATRLWALADDRTRCLAAAERAKAANPAGWPNVWAEWRLDPAFSDMQSTEGWQKPAPQRAGGKQ
jgi:serine/threonine-protein kinase